MPPTPNCQSKRIQIYIIIEAKDNNGKLFLDESADLLFHYLILLQAKGYTLQDVVKVLSARHSAKDKA